MQGLILTEITKTWLTNNAVNNFLDVVARWGPGCTSGMLEIVRWRFWEGVAMLSELTTMRRSRMIKMRLMIIFRYVAVQADHLIPVPSELSMEEAACVPEVVKYCHHHRHYRHQPHCQGHDE